MFDQEDLAFSGAFDIREFFKMRGVRGIREFCVDEIWVPGELATRPGFFYLLEVHGATARLYTEEFLEQTAAGGPEAIQRIIKLYQPQC